ncbi:MAG: cadmium-translocating P-type ATPase [Kosmotoga sp.]|uniref:heavy metal translocating P-type ATPase n=1 Tax=Kosmotoga sp. TaxID=1955248 RepID=UPI0025BBA40A|nr:heavy metal translocating P-type ATPase [Kosmotoga sp.]MCD6159212.1 cadmium-translocating P-type ATPase [Kosmotoga sp.]
MKKKYRVKNLDCASCAAKIEQAAKEKGMDMSLNFATQTLIADEHEIIEIQKLAKRIEPEVAFESEAGDSESNGDLRKQIITLAISGILFAVALINRFFISFMPLQVNTVLFLTAYIISGWRVLLAAVKNILHGNFFGENFLMSVATLGAIAIGEFPEAVAVMIFYSVGELFEDLAVGKSRRSIRSLLALKANYTNLLSDGQIKRVPPETVNPGQIILVNPGERIPLDGVVVKGESFLDTSALTGESVPRKVKVRDEVLSGMINTSGLLRIEVKKSFENSYVSKILELVENAASKKAPTEKFITKFSKYYTPFVVFGAAAIAFLPPLFIPGASLALWIQRALVLLVISCPCALVISIPLGYFGGIGRASKNGVLIKGSNFLDALKNVDTVVFDKTGTLTEGVFEVADVKTFNGYSKEEVVEFAAKAEVHSNHPVAKSIRDYGKEFLENPNQVNDYKEIPGQGVIATVSGKRVHVGNQKLLKLHNIEPADEEKVDAVVYVAIDGKYAGSITISDRIKTDAKKAIEELRKQGVKKIAMLTGDSQIVAEKVASELGIDEYYAELLPEDKVAILERLKGKSKGKVAFVGDGINDSPVLARADVGVAMGGLGSDAAIETADVVIMDDKPSKLSQAMKTASFTHNIIWQNILFALGVKGLFIALGTIGQATMWEAVFADVGVALLAVLNATRVLKVSKGK